MDVQINYWYLEHISSGKRILLQSGENTIGRHSSCRVVLQGNEFLSRMHAKLLVNTVSGVVLEQMNSLNGVFINKEQLKDSTHPLRNGDRIGLGVEIDEPNIVPPNYAIFLLKQMCTRVDEIIQISDDDDDDVDDNGIDKSQTTCGHTNSHNAVDKGMCSGIAPRILHLPIVTEVKAEALSAVTNDIENIFGEPDEELLESVLQLNPYVFKKLNNNILSAAPQKICAGDVIELHEDTNKEADDDCGNDDYDENFAMSQALLREMKDEMAFGGGDLSEEDGGHLDNDNMLLPIKMESDVSKFFDEDEIIIIDDEDDDLFSKVADWSSKLLSQNIVSQIYPMDGQENLGDNHEDFEDRPIDILDNITLSNDRGNHKEFEDRPIDVLEDTILPNDKDTTGSSKSGHKSTSGSVLDEKSKGKTKKTTRNQQVDKVFKERADGRNTKSSSKSLETKHKNQKHLSKSSESSESSDKYRPSTKNDTKHRSSSESKSSTRKRSYSSSTTDKCNDAISKPQETTAKETFKSVELASEPEKMLPESKTKSPSRSARLLNRSVSCYVERTVLIPETPLKEKTNRGPTLITAPHLPKHRGKARGVSAESKNQENKSAILERQRSKDKQAEMKKKWYQKSKDQKMEYEENKEKRREPLKKLAEKSKTATASQKSSSNLKRKHTNVPKPSNSNRGEFLTKGVEPSTSKKSKLDNAGKEEIVLLKAKLIKRRATLDCLSQLAGQDLATHHRHPAERKDAELARNRRTCNRVTFADMNRDFDKQQQRVEKAKRNRRVQFDDNVQIRIIERVEGAFRKIENAKDTNKLSLSTYAERREWALAIGKPQNYNDFIIGNILSWGNQWLSLRNPNEVAESDMLLPIPTEFTTYKQYKETFVPLMKVELLTTIEREYKNATVTYQVSLESFSNGSTTRNRPRFLLVTRCKNKPDKQFDLYTLSCGKHLIETFATMPRTSYIAGSVYELSFEILQKNISEDMLKSVKMLTVRPVVDNMRVELGAFSAVYQLGRSPLFRRILQPSENMLSFDRHILKDTEYKGFTKLNDHQIDICQSTWIRLIDDSTPSITLIQGPPGTGKSVVISNLALQCMYGKSNRKLDRKILICAHSNTAVDNITMYLKRARNCMKHSQFELVRFGRFDKTDPKVREVSLEYLLNIERQEKCKRLTAENTENLIKQQEMLKAEIAELNHKTAQISYIQQMLKSKERQLKILNERLNPPLTTREVYELSKTFIQRANIVCTTLSSCVKLASYIDYFDTCIIDEATQCTEPWTLLPLQFNVRGLVLVGDTQQLPATVLSRKANDLGLGNSMFDRIQRNLTYHLSKGSKNHLPHTKVFGLSMQYRMHPEICRWPNSYFYHDELVNSENTHRLISPIIPYCVVNLSYTKDNNDKSSRSISNLKEARFVAKLLTELDKHMSPTRYKYGLITPYSDQCSVLSREIPSHMMITPQTVDAYQGQERDVVIISNARTRGVGFLTNYQRLNVAITRPRRCLIICGNFDDLEAVDMWRHLLDDARNRQIYFNLKEADVDNLNRSLISKILVKPIEVGGESSS
ncbi:hypothetical protein KR044_009025 [Drosophila immigrans]|nr:hypothetical protein KR044_009025 [Drosophila immigrans]